MGLIITVLGFLQGIGIASDILTLYRFGQLALSPDPLRVWGDHW